MITNGQLQIQERRFGEITILDCAGRIIVAREADYLLSTVIQTIKKKRNVLLNLSGVTAIDSGGLGAFILLHRYAVNALCELKFCSPRSFVSETLALTELHTVLDLYDDEDAAIESFFRSVA